MARHVTVTISGQANIDDRAMHRIIKNALQKYIGNMDINNPEKRIIKAFSASRLKISIKEHDDISKSKRVFNTDLSYDDKIVAEHDLRSGMSVAQVARKLNVGYQKVYKYAKRIGYEKSWRKPGMFIKESSMCKSLISKEEMICRYYKGEKMADIAKIAGCSRQNVEQIVKPKIY